MSSSPERRSDLVSEMYTLVHEQAFLHEVTHEVRDWHGDGQDVVHGPWETSECQAVLIPWHRAGWVELVADADPAPAFPDAPWRDRATQEGAYLVLAEADARALLHEPSRWLPESADGHVMLSGCHEGTRHDYSAWRQRAEDHSSAVGDNP